MSAAIAAALLELGKPYVYFVEMDWAGTMERFWTGFGEFDWQHPNDNQIRTWYGTGVFARMNIPQESSEVQVSEMTFQLSGVDGDVKDANGIPIRERVNQDIRGGAVSVWLAFLKSDYTVDVTSTLREGVLDRPAFEDNGETATVRVFARADFPFLDTQEIKRWTPEQQIADLTGLGLDPASDTGLDLMHKQKDNTVAWLS